MIIKRNCLECKKLIEFVIPDYQYRAWQNGKHIQDAMPDTNPGEREMLISGICNDCFDDMFQDDDA